MPKLSQAILSECKRSIGLLFILGGLLLTLGGLLVIRGGLWPISGGCNLVTIVYVTITPAGSHERDIALW